MSQTIADSASDIDLLCPVMPYQLDRKERQQWENLVERISARAVVQGRGHDLLLYIYLAGFYHGVTLQQERNASNNQGES